jgi:hypothetical protein
VRIEQRMPMAVTHFRRPARRIHDVGEQHHGENTMIGHLRLVAGEELVDHLEGLLPRLNEVIPVAPGSSKYFAPVM